MPRFARPRLASTLLLWGAVATAGALTAQEPRPAPRPRAPATIMSFRGADWLERPQRAQEERPEQVLGVMNLQRGDVVADVGAGSGYFSRRMARLVSPPGTVYAVDVQPEMLEMILESMTRDGITGIVPVLGTADDPKLPAGEIDWILLVDVYHELENPAAMLAKMRESLAPGGRVALVEYRVEDGTGDDIRAEHRMSVLQVLSEWEAAGFELAELHEFLPTQHLFVLRSDEGDPGPTERPALAHYDVLEAVAGGHVELTATGVDADDVRISIRRTTSEDMVITLPVGTYFEASGDAGDMIARRDGMVLLDEDGPRTWSVLARRVDHAASAPGAGDRLEVRSADDHAELRDLTWLFQGLDVFPAIAPTVEQIAIWIIAEDLGWTELSAHARANSIHNANAVALAAAHVNAIGVDIRQKRIWAERSSFVPAITDEGLKRIFADLERN
ncbi:MAG: class I SAM-dependent methyltransferase [Gemmatimonadales bacterium]